MPNTQAVIDFVKANKVLAKDGVVCVDGRYENGQAGMLARPGGNFKGILVLLALRKKIHLTIGRIVDKGVEAIESMGYTFSMHTDDHADSTNLSAIGCGHIAKAADPNNSAEYGVDPKDVQLALMYLRIKLEGRDYYKMVELHGEHKERGVLVVTGTKFSVNHFDPEEGMFFVYDKTRDERFSKRLFERLEVPNLTYAEFKKVADKQLNATLKKLALGLPIYEVNVDKEVPVIKYMGKVT